MNLYALELLNNDIKGVVFMDSQSIEGIAVSQVNIFLYRSKQMLPYINIQDKIPTWDGNILLYRRPGKKTEDILCQLNVQVKGKVSEEALEKDEICYQIEHKHLRNFRIVPTIFFVVIMDNTGSKTSLYMTTFSPKKISEILQEYKNKGPEQKKTIYLQKVTSKYRPDEADALFDKLQEFNNDCLRQQRAHSSIQAIDQILMPINPRFLSIFGKFIDDSDIPAERICSVSRYLGGIIDVFLKDVIVERLADGMQYNELNIHQKIMYISDWDKGVGDKFYKVISFKVDDIFADISEQEVNQVVHIAIHIVEELFVKYFSDPKHRFGSEEILFYFAMLPLENRIYIMEKIMENEQNIILIEKLSLAYAKADKYDKAMELLDKAKENGSIDEVLYAYHCDNINLLMQKLKPVQDMNADKLGKTDMVIGSLSGNKLVVGFPSNKNMFDVQKAYDALKDNFYKLYKQYPEFTKLFMYLMQTDYREYNDWG